MSNKDKLPIGDRMKNFYENRSKFTLTRRTPVIIRLDGKCFHTFTKGFKRPFDENLNAMMRVTTLKLCKEIDGTKLAYTQSDEISILITDYDTFKTEAWFDYEIQKICSVSASIATAEFNKQFIQVALETLVVDFQVQPHKDSFEDVMKIIKCAKQAYFDSRCFNIPREEVINYFRWRYLDWLRNSIQMLSQSLYSHNELHGKNQADMHEMCFQKGKNWADLPDKWKNGNFCMKVNGEWKFLDECPKMMTEEGKSLIESLVYPKEE